MQFYNFPIMMITYCVLTLHCGRDSAYKSKTRLARQMQIPCTGSRVLQVNIYLHMQHSVFMCSIDETVTSAEGDIP